MKQAALFTALALWAGATFAAMGLLVSSRTEMIAGKLCWVCTYDVLGTKIDQIRTIDQGLCPSTINF